MSLIFALLLGPLCELHSKSPSVCYALMQGPVKGIGSIKSSIAKVRANRQALLPAADASSQHQTAAQPLAARPQVVKTDFDRELSVAAEAQSDQTINKIKVPPVEESLLLQGSAPQSQIPPYNVLRLFIWNVKKMKNPKSHAFLHRHAQRADVALIQEGGYGPKVNNFWHKINLTSGLWSFAVSYEQQNLITGVLTRTVYEPLGQKLLRSHGQEAFKKSHKMILFTYLPIRGHSQPLLVINVHGLNFVSLAKYVRQMERLAELAAHHKGPLVVGGDFNSYTWRRNRRLLDQLLPLGLKEVKMRHRRKNLWPWKFDRLFARGFNVVNARMMNESQGSDHEALWAELQFSIVPDKMR